MPPRGGVCSLVDSVSRRELDYHRVQIPTNIFDGYCCHALNTPASVASLFVSVDKYFDRTELGKCDASLVHFAYILLKNGRIL